MSRGSLINRTRTVGVVLRDVWSDVHPSQFPYEFLRVVVLVATQGHALSSGDRLRHDHRRISFRSTIGLRQQSLHHQPVTILHHYTSHVAHLLLAAFVL